jgi:hypothetical protein
LLLFLQYCLLSCSWAFHFPRTCICFQHILYKTCYIPDIVSIHFVLIPTYDLC